jgi:hypothetical protein
MNNWISVKDRLPSYRKEVIVHPRANIANELTRFTSAVAKYMGNDKFAVVTFDDYQYQSGKAADVVHQPVTNEITHWMPLPEPPDED